MATVLLDQSMSLDGYIAHTNDDPGVLHQWLFTADQQGDQNSPRDSAGDPTNRAIMEDLFDNLGAMIMGRRSYEVAQAQWGPNPPFHCPIFVITHDARPDDVREGGTTFHFVTEGAEVAHQRAQAAVPDGKYIGVMGAHIGQLLLKSGLLDEIYIHLIPALLGDGIRLFDDLGDMPRELEITDIKQGAGVTHIRYRVAS